jgi:ArsR family transcriptional regulator
MAIPSKTDFPPGLIRLAGYSKAMAHPVRLEILKILANEDCSVCGDLVDRLPYAQATVSQHLKVLKNSGLIKGETEGSEVRPIL